MMVSMIQYSFWRPRKIFPEMAHKQALSAKFCSGFVSSSQVIAPTCCWIFISASLNAASAFEIRAGGFRFEVIGDVSGAD